MTSNTIDKPEIFEGFPVNYYSERLSASDVDNLIPMCSRFCLTGNAVSRLLAAYFGSVESFERMRRSAIAEGGEIVEAVLPVVPAHYWSGHELANALQKAIGLSCVMDGEVGDLCRHLCTCILAEVSFRLTRI